MKKFVSLAMAGVMAASTCVVASAETADKQLEETLAMVKSRITVAEEISEFSYNTVNGGPVTVYQFTWQTPRDTSYEERKSISVTAYSNVITHYNYYSAERTWSSEATLAKLSSDQLYSYAYSALKKLNPTVLGNIKIDRDSLRMSVYSNTATFNVYRVKNGVPVESDTGRITLNKNTGELLTFDISWHPKASFKSTKGVISEEAAWDKYGEMISLVPQYDIEYDWEKDEYYSRLVYRQSDYGEINAYTGAKSDFISDGYYNETEEAWDEEVTEDTAENPETGGGNKFTEQELAEINKELPYGNSEAVKKLLKSNKYLAYEEGLEVYWDYLTKNTRGGAEKYVYTVSFSNQTKEDYFEYEEPIIEESLAADMAAEETPIEYSVYIDVTLDAQTGEIINYRYYNSSGNSESESYDLSKADKLSEKVMKSLAPTHVKDYTDYSSNTIDYNTTTYLENGEKKNTTVYCGSYHNYGRMVNGISVPGNYASVSFNADLKLTDFSIEYNDVEFADTKGMLSAQQVIDKFAESHDLKLYYKARTGKKKTLTVLVYGCNTDVYCDAFTGEQVYEYTYNRKNNDLSGITSPEILRKAKVLDDNGVYICGGAFTENTAAARSDFQCALGLIGGGYYDVPVISEESEEALLTRADAMVMFTTMMCGSKAAQHKEIFKNPFTDVSDDDDNLGYYAIAHALGAAEGTTLRGGDSYTYGDLINLLYDNLA